MKFKKLEIENFRPYKGRHVLEFSTQKSKPVTIITAPNNWGKTSVYESIRWCLYDAWPDTKTRGHSTNIEAKDIYKRNDRPFEVSVTLDFEHEENHFRAVRKFKYSKAI